MSGVFGEKTVSLGEVGEYGDAGEYCLGVKGEYAGLDGLDLIL